MAIRAQAWLAGKLDRVQKPYPWQTSSIAILAAKKILVIFDRTPKVVAKMQQLLAGQSASGMNQDSYAALSAIKDAIPNLEMSPDAGAKLMAELMVIP